MLEDTAEKQLQGQRDKLEQLLKNPECLTKQQITSPSTDLNQHKKWLIKLFKRASKLQSTLEFDFINELGTLRMQQQQLNQLLIRNQELEQQNESLNEELTQYKDSSQGGFDMQSMFEKNFNDHGNDAFRRTSHAQRKQENQHYEQEISKLHQLLDTSDQKVSELDSRLKRRDMTIATLTRTQLKLEEDLQSLTPKYRDQMEELQTYKENIRAVQERYREAKNDYEEKSDECKRLEMEKDQLIADIQKFQQSEFKPLQEKYKLLKQKSEKDKKDKDKLKKELKEKEKQYSEMQTQNTDLKINLKKQQNILETEKKKFQAEVGKLNEQNEIRKSTVINPMDVSQIMEDLNSDTLVATLDSDGVFVTIQALGGKTHRIKLVKELNNSFSESSGSDNSMMQMDTGLVELRRKSRLFQNNARFQINAPEFDDQNNQQQQVAMGLRHNRQRNFDFMDGELDDFENQNNNGAHHLEILDAGDRSFISQQNNSFTEGQNLLPPTLGHRNQGQNFFTDFQVDNDANSERSQNQFELQEPSQRGVTFAPDYDQNQQDEYFDEPTFMPPPLKNKKAATNRFSFNPNSQFQLDIEDVDENNFDEDQEFSNLSQGNEIEQVQESQQLQKLCSVEIQTENIDIISPEEADLASNALLKLQSDLVANEEIKNNLKNMITELQQQLDSATSQLTIEIQEKTNQVEQLYTQLSSAQQNIIELTAELNSKQLQQKSELEQIQQEIAKLKSDFEKKLLEKDGIHKTEVAQLTFQIQLQKHHHDEEVNKLTEFKRIELQDLIQIKEQELMIAKISADEVNQLIQSQYNLLQEEFSAFKVKAALDVEAIQTQLKENHTNQVNEISQRNQEIIDQISATSTTKQQQIKQEFDAQIERMTVQHEAYVKDYTSQHQTQIKELHDLMESLKAGHLSEVEALTQTMERRLISQTEESKKLLDDMSFQHESHNLQFEEQMTAKVESHASTLESLIASHNMTISSHLETQKGHLLELEQLKISLSEMGELVREKEQAITDLRSQVDLQLNKIALQEQELIAAKFSGDQATQLIQSQFNQLQEEISALKSKATLDQEAMQTQLTEDHENQIGQIIKSHKEIVDQLSATSTSEQQLIKTELVAQIKQLTAQHENFVKKQTSQHQNQITELHDLIESLKAGHLSEVEALTQTMERRLISQTQESKKMLDDLHFKHESLKVLLEEKMTAQENQHQIALYDLIASHNVTIGSHLETHQGHLLEIEQQKVSLSELVERLRGKEQAIIDLRSQVDQQFNKIALQEQELISNKFTEDEATQLIKSKFTCLQQEFQDYKLKAALDLDTVRTQQTEDHKNQILQISQRHQEIVEQFSATSTSEQQRINSEFNKEIEKLTGQHENFIKDQTKKQETQIAELHALIQSLKTGHQSEVESLTQTMESRLMSQTEESKNLLDDLNFKHESLKVLLEEKMTAKENYNQLALDDLIAKHNKTISSHLETQQGHLIELEQLKVSLSEMGERVREKEQAITDLRSQVDQQLNKIALQEQELIANKFSGDESTQLIQTRLALLQEEFSAFKSKAAVDLASMQSQLTEDNKNQIVQINNRHQEIVDQLQVSSKSEQQRIKSEFIKEIEQLTAQHQVFVIDQTSQHQTQISGLHALIEQLKVSHLTEVEKLTQTMEYRLMSQTEESKNLYDDLHAQHQSCQVQFEVQMTAKDEFQASALEGLIAKHSTVIGTHLETQQDHKLKIEQLRVSLSEMIEQLRLKEITIESNVLQLKEKEKQCFELQNLLDLSSMTGDEAQGKLQEQLNLIQTEFATFRITAALEIEDKQNQLTQNLRVEIDQINLNHQEKVDQLLTSFTNEQQRVKSELYSEIERLTIQQQAFVEDQTSQHLIKIAELQAIMQSLKVSHLSEVQELTQTMESRLMHQTEESKQLLEDLHANHESEIEDLTNNHATRVTQFEEQLEAFNEKHEEILKQMLKKYNEQLEEVQQGLNDRHEQIFQQMHEKFNQQLEELQQGHEQTIEEYRVQIEDFQTTHLKLEQVVEQLQHQLNSQELKLQIMTEQLDEANDEIQRLKEIKENFEEKETQTEEIADGQPSFIESPRNPPVNWDTLHSEIDEEKAAMPAIVYKTSSTQTNRLSANSETQTSIQRISTYNEEDFDFNSEGRDANDSYVLSRQTSVSISNYTFYEQQHTEEVVGNTLPSKRVNSILSDKAKQGGKNKTAAKLDKESDGACLGCKTQ